VIAAGNSGPDPSTIQSPGTSPEAITVGATSHSRTFGSTVCPDGNPCLEVSSSSAVPENIDAISYIPGEQTLISSAFGPFPLVSIATLDSSEEACSPLPANSLQGQIALVKRGSCLFSVKAEHVLSVAGAEAMVVYNNTEGPLVIMAFDADGYVPDKPAIMISIGAGLELRDFILENPSEAVIQPLEAVPAQPDILADFSSRGPSITQLIKPDLSAPGESIYTASANDGDYRLNVQGTSYSTPVVSGAAALLRQMHPEWPAEHIKSALVNTASKTTTINGRPTAVNEAGNGRLNLRTALQASGVLEPASLSLGLIQDYSSAVFPELVSLTNTSSAPRTFSLETVPSSSAAPAILVLSESSVDLEPGESETLGGSIQIGPSPGGAFEGYLLLTDDQGNELTISYWGVSIIDGGPHTLTVAKSPGANEFSSINSALEVALPGDTIEIRDSGTYGDPVRISSNSDGIQSSSFLKSKTGFFSPFINLDSSP